MSRKKMVAILLHLIFVAVIVIVVVFVMPIKHERPAKENFSMFIFTMLQVGGFYFTAYILHPRYLLRGKVATFVITACCLSFLISLQPGLTSYFQSPGGASPGKLLAGSIVMFVIGLFVMGTATAYSFIVNVFREQQLKQENLSTELSFLRSQVSPHFMFNTLNSLVSLARKQSDKLEPALMKMSGLMHYMLYDSDDELMSLEKEINYIQSYIDLQTMRFGSSVPILFSVSQNGHHHNIEPMLLIPLIENAFKHGTGIITNPEINIQLDVGVSEMKLCVLNYCDPAVTKSAERSGGIGLTNLRKRLNILYPKKHTLQIDHRPEQFVATLIIQFHQ